MLAGYTERLKFAVRLQIPLGGGNERLDERRKQRVTGCDAVGFLILASVPASVAVAGGGGPDGHLSTSLRIARSGQR